MGLEVFQGLARYNRWANHVVYDLTARLPVGEYRKVRPAAFFGSIHKTLNHILLVDYLWFGRFSGVPFLAHGLGQELYENFDDLRHAREAEDGRILGLMEKLSQAQLEADIHYDAVEGPPGVIRGVDLLVTVFNHQTHHRGQVHALLKEAGLKMPSIDYLDYLEAA